MSPPISVVITNYNYERFLRAAIDSALSQDPAPQVVVVDDGSSDGSRDIIDSYGTRVVAVLCENDGQTAAMNAGFERAAGEIVIFLDADDVLLPRATAALISGLAEGDAKAHWAMREIDEHGRFGEGLVPPEPLPGGDLRNAVIRDGPAGIECPPTSGNAWHRRFLEQVFPLPVCREFFTPGDDAYLTTLAPMFGRVALIETSLSAFRRHGASNYGDKPFDERLAHGLNLQERLCNGLEAVCRRQGVAVDRDRWNRLSWICGLHELVQHIHRHVPPGQPFVLIDDGILGMEATAGRPALPMLARDEIPWGTPEDDDAAIAALELHLRDGVRYVALTPDCDWWRDSFPRLFSALHERGDQILADEWLTLFRLYELPRR